MKRAIALCAAAPIATTPALACKGSWRCDYPKDFKNCIPHYDPSHPYANRVPNWAAKTDASITPYDGSWQHAFCDSKHHVVVWCPPAPDDEITSECASIEGQFR